MTESKIIFTKNDINIEKKDNNYHLLVSLANPNIYIPKLIDFSLLDIFYALNKDIFDDYKMTIHNDNKATIYFLFKHYYADLGITQKYVYLNVFIEKNQTDIQFKCSTIDSHKPYNLPKGVELLLFNNIDVNCNIITQHNVELSSIMILNSKFIIPEFLEKFSMTMFSKIILRIKQFIENYSY
jgi:hypothetical protein